MPKVNLGSEDPEEYQQIPEGEYVVEVVDVIPDQTKNGDEMWKLYLKIIDGEHAGSFLFDNLVFSEKAKQRAEMICRRLGMEGGEVDLAPSDLMKRRAIVTTVIDRSYDGKPRNKIPFDGWKRFEGGDIAPATVKDDDLPF